MMQVYYRLEKLSTLQQPLIFTIGNFDGVHRGHASVLKQCREIAGVEGRVIVLTFSNHPSSILHTDRPIPFLCTLPHRLRLIESLGMDGVVLIPFTLSIAKQTAASFIEKVRQSIPFSHLVLGHNAVMGRDRHGDQALMKDLASQWGFELTYLPEYRYEGKPISSTRIRQLLQEGNLHEVEELLGRPYSIYTSILSQSKDLSTLQLDVSDLCLPPAGEYMATLKTGKGRFQGTAFMRHDVFTQLEVNSSDLKEHLTDNYVEVIFHQER